MIEIISAIATSIIIVAVSVMGNKKIPVNFIAATILCSIAFIYVGFSLKQNTISSTILETCAALVFFFIAIIGYVKNNYLIAFGIIAHGIWDLLHYRASIIKTDIPGYWPLYCVVTDLITGSYFYFIFKIRQTALAPSAEHYEWL